jgi:hypothetical protein
MKKELVRYSEASKAWHEQAELLQGAQGKAEG